MSQPNEDQTRQPPPPMPPPTAEEQRASVRPSRPAVLTWAMVMFIVAAVCWFVVTSSIAGTASTGSPASSAGTLELLALIAYVVFAVLAARGRAWTRVGIPLLTLLLYFMLLPFIWIGFAGVMLFGEVYAIFDIVAVLASIAGLVLLYAPQSNGFFANVQPK